MSAEQRTGKTSFGVWLLTAGIAATVVWAALRDRTQAAPAQGQPALTPAQVCESNRYMAKRKAMHFIEARLHDPSSAQWPSTFESEDFVSSTVSTAPCTFEIYVVLRAKNAFGALVAQPYWLTVSVQGKDEWSLLKLTSR